MSDKKFWCIVFPVCVVLLVLFSFSVHDGVKEQVKINSSSHG